MKGVFRRGRWIAAALALAAVLSAATPLAADTAYEEPAAMTDPAPREPSLFEVLAEWFASYSRLSVPGG
jgi:hypothetical protein